MRCADGRAVMLALLWLLGASAGGWAQDAAVPPENPQPPPDSSEQPLYAGTCPLPPDTAWQASEAWAWEQICAGLTADLTAKYGGPAAAAKFDEWPLDKRRLSAKFLRHILSDAAYVNMITFRGVLIQGAYFDEPVDLTNLKFDKPLSVVNSVFEQPVVMENYRTESMLRFQSSWFRYRPPDGTQPPDSQMAPRGAALDLSGAQIDMSLILTGIAGYDIDLTDLAVKQHLYLDWIYVEGVVDLPGAHISGMLFARHAQIGTALRMTLATVEKDARFEDTHIAWTLPDGKVRLGALAMDNVDIRGSLMLGTPRDIAPMPKNAAAQPDTPPPGADDATSPTSPAAPQQTAQSPADGQNPGDELFPGPYTFLVGDINLNGASTGGELSIRTADIPGFLSLQDVHVGDDLWITSSRIGGNDLSGAVISGFLLLQDSIFEQSLFVDSAEIGRNLIMSRKTKISGSLQMNGTKLSGDFFGEGAHIGSDPPTSSAATPPAGAATPPATDAPPPPEANLAPADVAADLRSVTIGGDLNLTRGTTFDKDIDASFAHVGGSIDLSGGHFASVDLTGAHIGAELRLAFSSARATVSKGSIINLRNVVADSLLDVSGVWPERLELDGFTYRRFGGAVDRAEPAGDSTVDEDNKCNKQDETDDPSKTVGADNKRLRPAVCSHSAEELIEWLHKQKTFSTQPYSHLATMLRQSGDRVAADAIIFEGKRLQWRHTPKFSATWAWMTLGYVFTGFGVHPSWLLGWVLLLVVVGSWFFSRDPSPEIRKLNASQRVIYSLDMLLPVVHLRHHHYEIELEWVGARVYLYFHKIMGYVLASLLLAAISGGHQIE